MMLIGPNHTPRPQTLVSQLIEPKASRLKILHVRDPIVNHW
jgi:hypothetical protein